MDFPIQLFTLKGLKNPVHSTDLNGIVMMTLRNRPVSEKLDWILQVGGNGTALCHRGI